MHQSFYKYEFHRLNVYNLLESLFLVRYKYM